MKMLAGYQFNWCLRMQREKNGSDGSRSLQHYKSNREAGIRPYARCGDMVSARQVFNRIQRCSVVSWTNLMLGYVDIDDGEMALELFLQMQDQGIVPNRVAFIAALKACSRLCAKEQGKLQANRKIVKVQTLELVRAIRFQMSQSGYEHDEFVANSLVDVYGKCGSMDEASSIFHRMKQQDVASWNSIILGFAESGDGDSALQLFRVMQRDGVVPNARTYVAALKATCASVAAKENSQEVDGKSLKLECLEKGRAIHYELARRGHESDVVVASTLVDLYSRCGSMSYARSAGCRPNSVTFVAVLKACSSLAALELGREIHSEARYYSGATEIDPVLATSLIDFYGRCGCMVEAQRVFESISHSKLDLVAWNSVIAGYSRQGDTENVLILFEKLRSQRSIKPNGITFLSLLSACGHAGLVSRGKLYFGAMTREHGIAPSMEHYLCMVDLLSRANQLDEAVAMIESMEFPADVRLWKAVLAGCKVWRNVALGKLAFEAIVKLGDEDAATYVLMADICKL